MGLSVERTSGPDTETDFRLILRRTWVQTAVGVFEVNGSSGMSSAVTWNTGALSESMISL
jgi:hypothetical protein